MILTRNLLVIYTKTTVCRICAAAVTLACSEGGNIGGLYAGDKSAYNAVFGQAESSTARSYAVYSPR